MALDRGKVCEKVVVEIVSSKTKVKDEGNDNNNKKRTREESAK